MPRPRAQRGVDRWPPVGPPPWVRRPPWRPDPGRSGRRFVGILLAVQLGVTWLGSRHQDTGRSIDRLAVLLLVAASVVPVWSRRHSRVALVVVTAVTATYLGLHYPNGPVFLGLGTVAVSAAVHGLRPFVWADLAAGVSAATVVGRLDQGQWPSWSRTVVLAAIAIGIGLLGELARERSGRLAEMRRGGEERSLRQASDERLRLAQELHDVLAHDVSLMNVQASTALHLFDSDPSRARDALAAIKEVSHETLQELRATVSALRAADDDAPLRPAAGLADVGLLAERSTAAGLSIDVERRGQVRDLPARVELAGFRIVQEAVTNARRHSGAQHARVCLDYGPDALTVTVDDSGGGRAATSVDGHGLVGMRERARALGGELSTGPGPDGGFRVQARLPLTGPAAP
ncbi:MAG: hypothetical protein QOJ60_2602 [Actinomycetota bacterium]|jgi:signal transduction histidine kinase|nr:hypothetical protein [Actinomycetota bacterium]